MVIFLFLVLRQVFGNLEAEQIIEARHTAQVLIITCDMISDLDLQPEIQVGEDYTSKGIGLLR